MKGARTTPEVAALASIADSLKRIASVMEVMERADPGMTAARKAIDSERRLAAAEADSMKARMSVEELARRWGVSERQVQNRVREAKLDYHNLTRAEVAGIEAQHQEYRAAR